MSVLWSKAETQKLDSTEEDRGEEKSTGKAKKMLKVIKKLFVGKNSEADVIKIKIISLEKKNKKLQERVNDDNDEKLLEKIESLKKKQKKKLKNYIN